MLLGFLTSVGNLLTSGLNYSAARRASGPRVVTVEGNIHCKATVSAENCVVIMVEMAHINIVGNSPTLSV